MASTTNTDGLASMAATVAKARPPRRAEARPGNERPIGPDTGAQLVDAARHPSRHNDGGYLIEAGDYGDRVPLGVVRRTTLRRAGMRWQAGTPGTRVVAIDALPAVPGPLCGDPADTDTVLHDRAGDRR